MTQEKDLLRRKFSSEPDKYYRIELFDRLGFSRRRCSRCQRFFWTLDESRAVCGDTTCQQYEFLGNPTPKRFDYVELWRKTADYFVRNGHTEIKRYPVVCRWRPDIYFTIASIVDFQRVETGKVVFEFPANPLIVPQECLRFVDIGNVGITGRHYTSFCMIGQHALANPQGYWKDRCIELDYDFLTGVMQIPRKEIVFIEEVWLGPGAFGFCLEYFVRGLEMGNAVFTAFEGTPANYVEYAEKVVDMGAGLNRWAWLSNGTPTSYDVVFAEALQKLKDKVGFEQTEADLQYLINFYKFAGSLDVDEFRTQDSLPPDLMKRIGVLDETAFKKKLSMLQSLYAILDHTRTLLLAISDGALPSNVGGGYNLRVILRRALDFAREIDPSIDLAEIADWHIQQLSPMYPELREASDDVRKVIEVEARKYKATNERSSRIVESLVKKKVQVGTEKLIELYDSEGITPESLVEAGLDAVIPPDFYKKVTERHEMQRRDESLKPSFDLSGIGSTNLLFYLDRDQFEFEGTVLRIVDKYVILDSTAFYARSGGQEPDHGTIKGLKVVDVIKIGGIVLHEVEGSGRGLIEEGELVDGKVDSRRRNLIMRHHTATHVVNGAVRNILGSWVWQHSAFKDEDMARLDITHFSHLTREQVLEIERASNEIIRRNLPVTITWMPRTKAEQTYGFRIYQGGIVPTKEVRIVNIQGWDVEACGGTHCSSTGEIGLIKIIRAERIQDGVERLEFVAGEAALNYIEKQESILMESSTKLETPPDKLAASITNLKVNEERVRRTSKHLAKNLAQLMVTEIPKRSQPTNAGLSFFVYSPVAGDEGLDSEYHISVGDQIIRERPDMIYVALFNELEKSRVLVFCGEAAQKRGVKAGLLVREITKVLGGSGGGDARFGQGGVPGIATSVPDIQRIIESTIGL